MVDEPKRGSLFAHTPHSDLHNPILHAPCRIAVGLQTPRTTHSSLGKVRNDQLRRWTTSMRRNNIPMYITSDEDGMKTARKRVTNMPGERLEVACSHVKNPSWYFVANRNSPFQLMQPMYPENRARPRSRLRVGCVASSSIDPSHPSLHNSLSQYHQQPPAWECF
jgi:hypothetical protein